MQFEMLCNETATSGCQAEYDEKVYRECVHCHRSNCCTSDYSQTRKDFDVYNQRRNIYSIDDVTDASNCVNCGCSEADALVSLASSQTKCSEQDVEYLEIVAFDADDKDAYGDSKPSSCETNCRDKHDDDYLQLVADDDYHQLVASDLRYYGKYNKRQ